MAMPNDKMMEMLAQQQGGKTAPPMQAPASPSMSDASTGPMSAPMSTPEPKMGNREGAMVSLSTAMDLIEQALPALGSELRALAGVIGPKKGKTNELQTNEILQMLQSLPQAGGATPEGMAMAQGPAPGTPPMGAGAGAPAPNLPPQM